MDKQENVTNNIKVPNNDEGVLKRYFPQCFSKNGDFDIEKFKHELSNNEINFYKESYGLDWLGKSYARLLASDSATTLLKEDETFNQKDENKNSENLLIKGDNLEVLKHLANAYYEKIKMIYIDPPYNTGSDGFIYEDNRKFTNEQLQQLAGIDAGMAHRILAFTQSKSNSHSAWLTFMYPRLYTAKRLLKDDGVIFVSIDDNEVAQLRLLMDEIFGEENFVGQLPTIMNLKGNNDEFGFAGTHEFTIVYAKNKNSAQLNQFKVDDNDLEEWEEDEIGLYKQGANLKSTGVNAPRGKRPNLYFPVFIDSNNNIYVTNDNKPPIDYKGELLTVFPITNGQEMSWRWSKDKIRRESHDIIVSKNGSISFYKKQRPSLGDLPSKKPKTIFYKPEYSSGNGTAQIKKLFSEKVFPNAKPTDLIKDFIIIGSNTGDIILDFFAGSGTTGDAVMQLNAEDGGNRKYILVQLPEKINPKKDKAAYDFVKNELGVEEPTIFEITKERLIRAANKIRKEQKDLFSESNKCDLGLKIFETMPIWDNYDFEADKLDEQTRLFDDSVLTEDDIKALLVTWKTNDDIPLTEDLRKIDLGGYIGYYGNDKLYLMYAGFATMNLKALLEKINSDKTFNPASIIAFGYHFESKILLEISESVKSFSNAKNIDIDFITRY